MSTFRMFNFAIGIIFFVLSLNGPGFTQKLDVSFEKKYGQIEVGGPFAGIEFHRSRAFPSRISFYYPVANSIDLSRDYWKRDESLPFRFIIETGIHSDTISEMPMDYSYNPSRVVFTRSFPDYELAVSYGTCDDLPLIFLSVKIVSRNGKAANFRILADTRMVLRTCHTYTWREAAEFLPVENEKSYLWRFPFEDTDSATVFLSNAGLTPAQVKQIDPDSSEVAFTYQKRVSPRDSMEIVWLIGSCTRGDEKKISNEYEDRWQKSHRKNQERILDYAVQANNLYTGDTVVDQTVRWSRAVMASNLHYLDGKMVPMPCPAEYNFFFTHDMLLTDLGAVQFDLARVKKDLLYLLTLTKDDSILPHAYYWKDGKYVTEYCGTDNWNHFWFIILTGSYLKHSADIETVNKLFPVVTKSVQMVMSNIEEDGLMYATRPDWWDIGHIYGAQSYVSLLMIRSLEEYAALLINMNKNAQVKKYLDLADEMRTQLLAELWDDQEGYLFNMIDSLTPDRHYYSGSMIAAAFDILEKEKQIRLLKTAENRLLDKNLGIRNAMPADFHLLTDLYKFREGEVGAPYLYANGGIWPQGNIWYGLGLLQTGKIEESLSVLKKYLTLDGIDNSPNGQMSFYEYRHADPASPDYGAIDKPTFLWAGGLYLYYLYQLTGIRENAWNIYLSSDIPSSFEYLSHPVFIAGKPVTYTLSGKGPYFRKILMDGQEAFSSVLSGSIESLELERGVPVAPYLAGINCPLQSVEYLPENRIMNINLNNHGIEDVQGEVISPYKICEINVSGQPAGTDFNFTSDNSGLRWQIRTTGLNPNSRITVKFCR